MLTDIFFNYLMQKVTKLRDTVTGFTICFTNEFSLPSELIVFLNLLLFGSNCRD